MPDIRERKQGEKFKGHDGGKPVAGKDLRRQMTAKLQKEFLEQKQARQTGGGTDEAPESEAAENIVLESVSAVEGLAEHTRRGASKVFRKYQGKHEKPKERPRGDTRQHSGTAQNTPAAPAETPDETAAKPPTARERMRRKAAENAKTKLTDKQRDLPLLKERPATAESSPIPKDTRQWERPALKERPATAGTTPAPITAGRRKRATSKERLPAYKPTGDPPTEKGSITAQPPEKMRQTAIREKRSQQISRERSPSPPRERPKTNAAATCTENAATPPTPQQRMMQKTIAEKREQRAESGREPSLPHTKETMPRPELPPAPADAPTVRYRPKTAFPGEGAVSEPISANHPIRERPRSAAKPKEKPTGGASVPKTRQGASIRTGTPKPKQAPTAMRRGMSAARQTTGKARLRVQRNAQRQIFQKSTKAAKAATSLTKKVVTATGKAVAALISALAGLLGGAILIPVIIVIILVAAIIASPFGILFSNEPTPDATPLNIAVGQLNRELSNRLEELQDGDYDDIDIQGQAPDWRQIVAVFATKTAGADDGVDVAALTPDRVDRLKTVFWDMCIVTSEVETIDHEDSDPDDNEDDSYTETFLHITITAKTADDMRTEYAFSDYQNEALSELIDELATMEILLTDLTASEEQARELIKNLPDDLAPERRAVVETACELVGKVTYFWGGKSLVIGWDNRWGTVMKVWAADSPTTGTYRPYGLDCSGFVDWVFYNATDGAYYPGHGGGTDSQLADSTRISWDEAQPGDLVFYSDVSHVGIVGGRDADGNLLIIHCTSGGGLNGTTITGAGSFGIVARPSYFTS